MNRFIPILTLSLILTATPPVVAKDNRQIALGIGLCAVSAVNTAFCLVSASTAELLGSLAHAKESYTNQDSLSGLELLARLGFYCGHKTSIVCSITTGSIAAFTGVIGARFITQGLKK